MTGLAYDASATYDGDSLHGFVTYAGSIATLAAWVALGDDLIFNGAADDFGVEWYVENLEGWDSPDVRAGSTPRPGDDGLWLSSFRHGGRILGLTGHAVCPSADVAYEAKDRLARAANLLRSDALLRVHEDRTRRVTVRRNDRLHLRQIGPTVEFSVPLLAADPRKYADEESTLELAVAEVGAVENEGAVATRHMAVIRGPITTPTMVNAATGEEVGFDLTLAAGDELEIDFDLRTATSEGVSVRSYLLPGYSWWEIDEGITPVRLDGTGFDGDAGWSLTWRSAWI